MILTCPFCGSTPNLIYRKIFKEYFVACSDRTCQAMAGRIWSIPSDWTQLKIEEILEELRKEGLNVNGLICKTKQEAIDRWNRTVVRKEVALSERIV